jgi:hypothetical protein
MPRDKQRNYQVGYGKPPRHTRFQSGQSGNPNGRPAGKKNLLSVLSDALQEPVTVVENGRRKRITKLKAIGTQLVNRAASGDPKATALLLSLSREIDGGADPGSADTADFTEADQQIIQRIQARLQGKKE